MSELERVAAEGAHLMSETQRALMGGLMGGM
jgi:hypothetical protein